MNKDYSIIDDKSNTHLNCLGTGHNIYSQEDEIQNVHYDIR